MKRDPVQACYLYYHVQLIDKGIKPTLDACVAGLNKKELEKLKTAEGHLPLLDKFHCQ